MGTFIKRECDVSGDEYEQKHEPEEAEADGPTASDKEFLDDSTSVDDQCPSDYRKADRFIDMGPDRPPVYMRDFTPGAEPLDPYRKVSCVFCKKQISATNLSKHKKACYPKHDMCYYKETIDGVEYECNQWINKKDMAKHKKTHEGSDCTICKKWIEKAQRFDHEVECRVNDMLMKSRRDSLEKLKKEYDKYVTWCTSDGNTYRPKAMTNWLKTKLEKKSISQEEFVFFMDELKKEDTAKKTPTPKRKTPNPDPPQPDGEGGGGGGAGGGGGQQRKQVKKRKSTTKKNDEDDEEAENCKKPSQNFEVTMIVKYDWVFNTIVKYMLTTFFDGYKIPSRFKKTWPLGRRSTTLFPHSIGWRELQKQALQKKSPTRIKLRRAVRRIRNSANLDIERMRLMWFDYNMNPKRYFRRRHVKPIPLIQEYIAGEERGLGAPLHCHMYLKTKQKMYLNTLRRFFRRFRLLGNTLLNNIATLRSPRDWIRYITKEDKNAVVRNVDKERCHNNYIMWNFAKLSKRCNISMYSVYRWSTQGQMNKYRDIHAAYWEPIVKRQAYAKAMDALSATDKEETTLMADFLGQQQPKKGIYLYGEPKTGKSTTALAITKGDHYQVPEGSSTFAFHSWQNEPYILFEDVSDVEFLHYRNKVNQLCDEHGLCFAQTKGGGSKLITCDRVIVTSNYEPPREDMWPGFARRFVCVDFTVRNKDRDRQELPRSPPQ